MAILLFQELDDKKKTMKLVKEYPHLLNGQKDRVFDLGINIGKYIEWIANSKLSSTGSLLFNQKRQSTTRDTFSKLFQNTNEKYISKRSRNND